MNRRRMILTLTMLFIVSLFLIGFGNWLWAVTDYWYYNHAGVGFFEKPFGTLGLVLVMCGVPTLAVALGLSFDWHHLLADKPSQEGNFDDTFPRMTRRRMSFTLAGLFILSFFLIVFGYWLYVFTYYTDTWTSTGPVKTLVQPYWTMGLGFFASGLLILAAIGLLFSWYQSLIPKRIPRPSSNAS